MAAVLLLCLSAAPSLFCQSLVEAAKKERERREAYGRKKVVVLTNNNLPQIYGPVLSKPSPPLPAFGAEPAAEDFSAPAPALSADRPSAVRPAKSLGPDYVLREGDLSGSPLGEIQQQALYEQSKTRADNLELRMMDLWELYMSSRDKAARRSLENEMGELVGPYNRAREEEAREWVKLEQRAREQDR